jgi:membrane protein implicated in regulation of membrane protease activity
VTTHQSSVLGRLVGREMSDQPAVAAGLGVAIEDQNAPDVPRMGEHLAISTAVVDVAAEHAGGGALCALVGGCAPATGAALSVETALALRVALALKVALALGVTPALSADLVRGAALTARAAAVTLGAVVIGGPFWIA